MNIDFSNITDYDAWISLAREVEPLFGPMADEELFQEALRQAISEHRAFCIREKIGDHKCLKGGIIISKEPNEIAWLAVSGQYRGKGLGRQLLKFAVGKLNLQETIFVQTFDESIPEGRAARKLYLNKGFIDCKDGGLNPAGMPTVIMKLTA
ncbi:MAG: GNAT family N-acetyltransferase [Desulfococcaceae bacterium]